MDQTFLLEVLNINLESKLVVFVKNFLWLRLNHMTLKHFESRKCSCWKQFIHRPYAKVVIIILGNRNLCNFTGHRLRRETNYNA